jgi:hypothetical protein
MNALATASQILSPLVALATLISQEGIQGRQLRSIKALADAYEREKARADAAEAKLAQPK